MSCEELPQELIIRYQDEDVRVLIECVEEGTFYLVYLGDEDGYLRLHKQLDQDGHQVWFEGDTVTDRAEEIGQLLMAENR